MNILITNLLLSDIITDNTRIIKLSIYSDEKTDCIFLKQRNGQVKIKKIGNDNTAILSVKCAIFDPYTSEYSNHELDKRITKYDSLDKIAVFDKHEDKDDIINKLQQQTEKLERKLNEETRKYQVSQDKLDVGKSSKLSEEKSELDEDTIKHQDSIEKFTTLNDQLITKDINKFRQQTEKLERQLNEETGKYQVSQDKLDVGKSSKLSEKKSELDEEKSELDEETIIHQDFIEIFPALDDQLITKYDHINKFQQQTEKLERQSLNEETGKHQVFRDKFISFNNKLKDKKVAENDDNFAQEIEKNENEI
ncbi:hypothetical protein C1646_430227 [Rhizophagus diaphanus]|nr:hypothetical protein C1646_430227 [Rhizophagus diaphanus] [Rhizophagus sp. MUCL 43196]